MVMYVNYFIHLKCKVKNENLREQKNISGMGISFTTAPSPHNNPTPSTAAHNHIWR